MSSQSGNIGPYRVERELGRGGMGVVYLATDTRLDRKVAIKQLPPSLVEMPDRLARFQREAKVLASLHHPGIAGIYGVEDHAGTHHLVLEYVEGETLAARLERGTIPLDEALDLAVQVALALEAAHEKGVIHRDIKPGNIMVTPEGRVKVLDFGLARTDESASSTNAAAMANSPTITSPAVSPTMPGIIMGTAGYMSPEQARGRMVDKRSDIFSFGCLLYEMLTGARPFVGETVADALAATIHREPDLALLPEGTPPAVVRVLRRCLAKDKSKRLHDIADARLELEIAHDEPAGVGAPSASRSRLPLFALVAAAFAIAAGAWIVRPAPTVAPAALPVFDAEIVLPEGERLGHGFYPGVAISPDGRTIAFNANKEPPLEEAGARPRWLERGRLVVRRLDQPGFIPLAGADPLAWQPAFSPDGQWIAYASGMRDLFKISVNGGQPIRLGSAPRPILGIAWAEDDTIILGQIYENQLLQVPASGGAITALTEPESADIGSGHGMPHALPGGGVLYTSVGDRNLTNDATVWVLDRRTGSQTRLLEEAAHAQYAAGHIVFARRGRLMAAPFDLGTLRLTGEARLVNESAVQSMYFGNMGLMTSAAQFALSREGTLVLAEGSVPEETIQMPVWVDREGVETPIETRPGSYILPRVSRDGRDILLLRHYAPARSLWLHEVDRSFARLVAPLSSTWFAAGPGVDEVTLLATHEDKSQIRRVRLSNPSAFDHIEPPQGYDVNIGEWSRDGRRLVALLQPIEIREVFLASPMQIWAYEEGAGWSQLTQPTSYLTGWPAISPDGRWLAFASNESGDFEVFVRPLGRDGPARQVSVGGGREPLWSNDGAELLYRRFGNEQSDPATVMSVLVSPEPGDETRLRLGRPGVLFVEPGRYTRVNPVRAWDIAPDGRFVFLKQQSNEDLQAFFRTIFPDRLRVVQNWAARLER